MAQKLVGFYSKGHGRKRKVYPILKGEGRSNQRFDFGSALREQTKEMQGARTLESDARNLLNKAASMPTSEQLLHILRKYSGLLGDYSPYNAMLIEWRDPNATIVHSRKDWERLGYKIRENARGISVLVPLFAARKVSDVELSKFIERMRAKGHSEEHIMGEVNARLANKGRSSQVHVFSTGKVFDASSVDGNPIPEHEKVRMSTIYEAGKAAAREHYTVEEGSIEKSRGYTAFPDDENRVIRVMKVPNENVEPLHTLFHELGHARLHGKMKIPRGMEEQEAELTSYLVLQHFGIDDTKNSAAYIANWGQNGRLKANNIDRAMSAASWIISQTQTKLDTMKVNK